MVVLILRRWKSAGLTAILICVIASANSVLFAWSDGEITVSASFEGKQTLKPQEQIEFRLNRAITSAEGRLAVVIGRTDISGLLITTSDSVVYIPKIIPLPAGESPVTLYLVTSDNAWKQIARFSIRVESIDEPQVGSDQQAGNTVQQDEVSQSQSAGIQASPKNRVFDKAQAVPSITIGMKSQAAESHFPDSTRPDRPQFADMILQASMRSELARGIFNSQTQFDIVGSSFQKEALRFAEKGDIAPKIDLSSYLMQFQAGKVKFDVGHIAVGTNRHLINGFSSRGLSLTLPVTSNLGFSLAAINGTSIVGWDNFFGLSRSKHQILSASLGLELIKERSGGLRIEGSMIDGQLLPISNFNQGNINDAERSNGVGIRVLASDSSQKWRLDGGFARSRFTNPSDPLLAQGQNIVAVSEVTRNARYLEASYVLLRDISLSESKKANLTINYRHEQVDPLYRSIAASTQADRAENQFELVAAISDITATFSHLRFHDNLADIPSILKSLNHRTAFIIGTPLGSFFNKSTRLLPWLPRVSYSIDETHQFSDSVPVNGGFDVDPSTIPDQMSTNQSFLADWQIKRIRFGYRFNRSYQDNRQVGRERADLSNITNGFTFGCSPSSALDLNLDINAESAFNKEADRIDRTFRIAPNVTWRLTQNMTVAALVSATFAGDVTRLSRSRNLEADLQWSYRIGPEKLRMKKTQGQFFVKYANRYAFSRDNVFNTDNLTRLQTLNAGISFTFF